MQVSHAQAPGENDESQSRLTELITSHREQGKLVGLAAMVTVDGQVVASAVDGERKIGSGIPLEIGDRWHLGSITKSITATTLARLVEAKEMKWSDTIGECFPDASLHDDWKPVSLRQLLTHTAGAPANFSLHVALQHPPSGAARTRARRAAVLDVIASKPAHSPGEKFAYSNVGYTIAGAMAEQMTGETWEDLVIREVFEPLNLTGAGFGPPKSTANGLEQPRGHRAVGPLKVAMSDDADNTPIIGPAGIAHMTLDDLCTYANDHLGGELGNGKLLSAETYKLLHTPVLDGYACGWVKKEAGGRIPHTVFWHNGSNTMWYALIVFIPDKHMVVAVTSNDGDREEAESAACEIVIAFANPNDTKVTPPLSKPREGTGFPRKSPFSAVRWQDTKPEVRVADEWFQLVSLDGIAAADIVAFCQRAYSDRWQMRFEQDLVEVLSGMDHKPKDTVRLVVIPVGSSKERTLERVRMTEANRQAIRAAAR